MTTAVDPETTTFYVLFDDGSASLMTSTTGEEPPLPKPGRFVDQTEYEERRDAIRAEREEYVAELQAEDERRTREDYEALIATGVPEATARRLSGYTGPGEES
ncbi:hypothetical protein B0E38_01835 [Streptomyces sp. 111WW2]|uniref:hypothetical protein n=1 Tax=Streptomyces sp. 111WW2 TaxID=1945515 RepID=UPI000D0C7C35|nr:hypothetical protein [Streptomyces sp. 111WW2]PSK57990.1 hypothetical protein B0E38_01835 [Streptomyces sp. 111WW2]